MISQEEIRNEYHRTVCPKCDSDRLNRIETNQYVKVYSVKTDKCIKIIGETDTVLIQFECRNCGWVSEELIP